MARSADVKIDPETGLPALRDGLAWEVREVRRGSLKIYLVCREESEVGFWGRLFGEKPETTWEEFYWDDDSNALITSNTKEGVLEAATKIYKTIQARESEQDKLDSLVGLYPPKTIL